MPKFFHSRQWQRFKAIRRGYVSLLLLLGLIGLSLIAELLVNSRAIVVKYEGDWYFPTYQDVIPGTTFGESYEYETQYRDLSTQFSAANQGNWVLMPLVPYNAFESDLLDGEQPPYAPSAQRQHYLGTDGTGRDIVARLFYGFRISIAFALVLMVFEYAIGIVLGCMMGFFGGKFDLVMQRVIEIWSNVPSLYIIIILSSIVVPNFWSLLMILVAFSWISVTTYMRTASYRESAKEYVLAARAMGAGPMHIIRKHILPNSLSIVVTFAPFSVAAGITALTSLDYLGFGLPAPTPSWGELLKQAVGNMESPWIVTSVTSALTVVLVMVTFIGEAVREAFDPKQHTVYE